MGDPDRLPPWVTWQQRPFPDANLLLLPGGNPTLVDSGFVGHEGQTADWVHAHTGQLVVNTHWHADHVGGNGMLQTRGAGIAASAADGDAVARRDPGCCQAEYLDQPVAPYTVDEQLDDGQIVQLGDAEWQVICTPGHTPGHLSLWQPDERLLAVGDALSDYYVGWVNIELDGPSAAAAALASLQRLLDLSPRVLLPAHGPIPADTASALTAATRRAQRLVDDPVGAVWYAARRIFAYALMIHADAKHAPVTPDSLDVPLPRLARRGDLRTMPVASTRPTHPDSQPMSEHPVRSESQSCAHIATRCPQRCIKRSARTVLLDGGRALTVSNGFFGACAGRAQPAGSTSTHPS